MVTDGKVSRKLSSTVKSLSRKYVLADGSSWHPGETPAESLNKAFQADTFSEMVAGGNANILY